MLSSSNLFLAVLKIRNAAMPSDPPLIGSDNNEPASIGSVSLMSSREFWLSVLLLIFGLLVIAAQLYYLKDRKKEGDTSVSAESVVRLTIVSMIIVGSLILISSGYSSNQIGPAMGLFGTVAGYLIGRHDK